MLHSPLSKTDMPLARGKVNAAWRLLVPGPRSVGLGVSCWSLFCWRIRVLMNACRRFCSFMQCGMNGDPERTESSGIESYSELLPEMEPKKNSLMLTTNKHVFPAVYVPQ